jgi:glucose/arabinose dehydrogenase
VPKIRRVLASGRRFAPRLSPVAALLALGAVLAALAASPLLGEADAVRLDRVGTFDRPIYVTAAPGDERRLFVVEREGRIRMMLNGRKLQRPFLRIPGGVSTNGEQGLLSMAFHPGYERNRRFYVFYTDDGGALRIDEFRRSKSGNRATRQSQRRVLDIGHSDATNHNGGQFQFGPDGLLYISTGDGGGSGDPDRNGQDVDSLLGKILRIDPRPSGGRRYTVPRSNQFVGGRGQDEIFALGLRNPFRFSFDRATGALAIGDVGQGRVEEVNYRERSARPGANFGWNCFEGSDRYEGAPSGCNLSFGSHAEPVIERRHSQGDCAVIGGYIARHESLGQLRGRYVYGDLCTGIIRSARLTSEGTRGRPDARVASVGSGSLVSFGEGAGGRLYVVSQDGPVYQLRD